VLLHTALTYHASAATLIWTGPTGADTNWSTGSNWTNATAGTSGTAPSSGDDVKFFDAGTVLPPSTINNTVDGGFSGTIASLQFGNTNNTHTTLISSGTTLNITGANGLVLGTPGDVGVAKALTNAITGAGAALNLNNTSASLVLNQGSAVSVTGTRAILDLSGLDSFTMNGNRIGIGTTTLANPGSANQREAGLLFLAKTNLITLATAAPLATYQATAGQNPAIELSHNPGNNAGILSILYLGQTNAFFIDSISAGRTKASANSAGIVQFNPAFPSSVAYFRGIGGDSSRVTWWSIADMCTAASSAQVSVGTNNFTGGTIDARIETLSLARDTTASHTATPAITGVLTFNAGQIDANAVIVGNQSLGPVSSTTPLLGIVNVNGSAKLTVNSNLILANTTINSVAANRTSGILNINNGTVWVNSISMGASATNSLITMTNGTLILTNTAGTPAKGLTTLTLTNSALQLNITSATNIVATNLVTGGATNLITIATAAVLPVYPAQVALIAYSSASIGGVGYNFGLDTFALPASAPGAYLSNNVAGKSIDLVLPNDPRPVITSQPVSYSGSPGDNVTFTVGATGVPTLAYQWRKDGVDLSDGGNLSGATTTALSITSAQPSDNGNYTVVITNVFGATTSTPPAVLTINAGNIAPSITGPNDQTAIQGNNATFTASVAGVPAPSLQWRKDGVDIPGATTASFTVNNAQHPSDDGTYSIVATNVAGSATNSASLTVIVPPTISVQPANTNVVSGSAASFSVSANGFPAPGYQWKKNGAPIANATTSTLAFPSAQPSDAANYSVQVTNAAGSISSSSANLIVNSTMTATSLSPNNGAVGVCLDTLLRITFDAPPVLGNGGRIRIFNVTNTTTPVDTIDLGLNLGSGFQSRNIAATAYNTYPVIISNNTATIFPHAGVLTSNQTYYVTIENVVSGAFKDGTGATFSGISDSTTWQFTTKSANPPAGSTNIVVAADGSGDFCTVQGAVDSLPANSNPRVVVNIRNGYYQEIVYVNAKNNITFRGQERTNTIIAYPNNDPLNGGTSLRPMFRARGNDLGFDSLTLTNSTPKGGSQAEALRIDGQRDIFTNIFLASFQDTLLINNVGDSAYFLNCLIQGDTDFIWGSGTPYFQNCEIRALNAGHNTQMRTDAPHYGATFADCLISKTNGATFTTHTLGRGIGGESDNGNATYLNCRMDNHILPAGWQAGAANQTTLRYWEFQSVALDGVTPIDVSQRAAFSQQISASQAVQVRNLTNVLAGWFPPPALSITSQPSNQVVNAFQPAAFAISASGVFAPNYQWRKDGVNISGATVATLNLPHAHLADAGGYDCVVSNVNGVLASSIATLTVIAPTQPSVTAFGFEGGQLAMTIAGDIGPDYAVQASTNLVDWQTIFTTNSPATPFNFADPDTGLYSVRFYRIAVGPPLP
jgi:pectin methylesterase-like acyl-CoA thioesterase